MFRTSNPAFRNSAYATSETWDDHHGKEPSASTRAAGGPKVMTVQGTVNKTLFLLSLTMVTAMLGWNGFISWGWSPMAILLGGGLGGMVLAFICIFKPKTSPVVAPLYAATEGIAIGGISAVYASSFARPGEDGGIILNTGLVFNAALLTFGIMGGMLVGYATKVIRPGPLFKKVWITVAMGMVFYFIIAFIASMFGSFSLGSVYSPHNGGTISILFSLVLVGLASTGLLMDFEMVEVGARNRAPRYMEWYSGFAILLSLVWLYLELLRLLAKLQSRR